MASAKRGHASPACFLRSGYHAGRLSVLATSRPATGAKVSGGSAAAPGKFKKIVSSPTGAIGQATMANGAAAAGRLTPKP